MSVQVPKGYKQTEVGVIPEDWDVSSLAELCSFENGDRSSNYPSGHDFTLSGVPFINAGHLDNGKISFLSMDYIKDGVFNRLTRGKVKHQDILYCIRGSLGKFGVVEKSIDRAAIASSLVIIRLKNKKVTRQYFQSFLDSSHCLKMIENWAGGAAQPNLGVQDLSRFLIAHPRNELEQNLISKAISDADALIESLEQLIAKKRQIKQGAMQELLTGQRRLPGFSGGWVRKKLGDVATLNNGFAFKSSSYSPNGQFNIVTIANVQDGFMDLSYCNRIIDIPRELQIHQKLKVGDILVSMTGNVGRVCLVNEENCLLNQRVGKISCFSVNQYFLFSCLKQSVFAEQMDLQATGGAQGNISKSDILDYEIDLPPVEEQAAIENLCRDFDLEIDLLGQRLDKARQIKQSMMQELLTGRIRLI